jgi:hypothetical protein
MSLVLGIDPGATTGLALLDVTGPRWNLLQVATSSGAGSPSTGPHSVSAVMWLVQCYLDRGLELIAVERFVVGPRAAKSRSAAAGQLTRHLVGALSSLGGAGPAGLSVRLRPAAEVKPWATDERLKAAGCAIPGMRHAVDAARQALFAACKDLGMPDPLSSRSPTR